jgi:hypothetical protein
LSIDAKTGDFFVANELQGYLMQSIQIMGDRLEIPSHLHNGNWDTEPHFDSADWDDTRVVIDGIIRQSKTDFAEFSLLTDQ